VFFSVREPEGPESPLVVEVPHAGLWIDPESLWTIAAPARSIGRDADLYVNELYEEAPRHGASVLVSHVSRYVCDLNREEGDVDHLAVEGAPSRNAPHGLIWRSTTDDQPALFAPLSRRELTRRLDLVYRPYHRTLRELLERKRRQFGFAILLCAHSMPSFGRAGHGDTGKPRADVVPGTRGGSALPQRSSAFRTHWRRRKHGAFAMTIPTEAVIRPAITAVLTRKFTLYRSSWHVACIWTSRG
jgi:N-formylglutamate deformylase